MGAASTPTLVLVIVAVVSAAIPAIAPILRGRKASPDSTAVVLTASATYLSELHERMKELEDRVARLERENRAYFNAHGPPPADDQGGSR